MYGYTYPRKPEPGSHRVMICESEVQRYLEQYPRLDRSQVIEVLKAAGQSRAAIDAELRRLSSGR